MDSKALGGDGLEFLPQLCSGGASHPTIDTLGVLDILIHFKYKQTYSKGNTAISH